MAKNYDNIEITTTSSDTYSSFEKSYSFDGIYRRIIGLGDIGTRLRTIIKTQEIDSETLSLLDENGLTVDGNSITYVRIKNLHASTNLEIVTYNSELGTELYLILKGGESMQFHSEAKFDNSYILAKWDYLAIAGDDSSARAGADIFIGFED